MYSLESGVRSVRTPPKAFCVDILEVLKDSEPWPEPMEVSYSLQNTPIPEQITSGDVRKAMNGKLLPGMPFLTTPGVPNAATADPAGASSR